MNKFLKSILIIIFSLFTVFIIGYVIITLLERPDKINSPISETSYCSDLKWRKVKTGYDTKTVIELATKLEATAKLDAKKIDSTTSNFSTGLEKIISSNSGQEFEVSEELYDNLIAYCTQITIISRLIKDGAFGTDQKLLYEIRKELLRISVSFGKIKEEEAKRDTGSNISNTENRTYKENTETVCSYSGTINDFNGMPLSGVKIYDDNNELLFTTGSNGKFSFKIDKNKASTHKATFLCTKDGYSNCEIIVFMRSESNIQTKMKKLNL